jgi:hypothetical protein
MADLPDGGYGQQTPYDDANDFTRIRFLVSQMLAKVRTNVLVQVISCTNDGSVAPVGRVVVQPLVNQVDGNNVAVPHGPVYSLLYFRYGGANGQVMIDPAQGDIGWAAICDRDITSVKNTGQQSNPGSYRKFDLCDGIYSGICLGPASPMRIRFAGNQIIATPDNDVTTMTLVPGTITMKANSIVLDGNVSSTGTFQNNGTDISSTHVHPGVQSGASETLPPV